MSLVKSKSSQSPTASSHRRAQSTPVRNTKAAANTKSRVSEAAKLSQKAGPSDGGFKPGRELQEGAETKPAVNFAELAGAETEPWFPNAEPAQPDLFSTQTPVAGSPGTYTEPGPLKPLDSFPLFSTQQPVEGSPGTYTEPGPFTPSAQPDLYSTQTPVEGSPGTYTEPGPMTPASQPQFRFLEPIVDENGQTLGVNVIDQNR